MPSRSSSPSPQKPQYTSCPARPVKQSLPRIYTQNRSTSDLPSSLGDGLAVLPAAGCLLQVRVQLGPGPVGGQPAVEVRPSLARRAPLAPDVEEAAADGPGSRLGRHGQDAGRRHRRVCRRPDHRGPGGRLVLAEAERTRDITGML